MRKIFSLAVLIFALKAQAQHQVNLTSTDTSCTTSAPCTLQIYRAVVASGQSCPTGYTSLVSTLAGTATATGTSWSYSDTSAALTSGSVACYYATATFTAGGGPSAASAVYQAQIPAAVLPLPPVLTGSVVK